MIQKQCRQNNEMRRTIFPESVSHEESFKQQEFSKKHIEDRRQQNKVSNLERD